MKQDRLLRSSSITHARAGASAIILILLLSSGCQTPRDVTFGDREGYKLLGAARQIHVGDTRQQVMHYLGWRRDQSFVEAAHHSADNDGGLMHPQLNIWHWQAYPIDLSVGFLGFSDEGRVWAVWYYDDSIKPSNRIMLTGPNLAVERTPPSGVAHFDDRHH